LHTPNTIESGAAVQVRAFGGEVLVRRCVRVVDGIAHITTNEEFEAAQKDGREPVCIGFPFYDVTEQDQP